MNNPSIAAELPDVPPPPVLWWYRVYGMVIGLGLEAVALLVVFAIVMQVRNTPGQVPWGTMTSQALTVGMYAFAGLFFMIAPAYVPRTLVAYLFHGALIGMTMLGCCTIPIAGALLYFWVQSDTRFYFGVGS